MPHAPATPEQLFRTGLEHLWGGDVQGWLDTFTDDVVFEFPFAPKDRPKRLVGKEALASYIQDLPETLSVDRAPHLTVHETTDQSTVVIEMSISATVKATGAAYDQDYVIILWTSDGKVTRYRDYWNPLVGADLGGDA
ncbi:nuclear transport factor 2 family protein [Nesterenkonia xinjiangensis]|uniref:SnoaL-like domain-containing protein n=1 Tax=Nesterenkonia xinjiangensis TaxID=225327 RepID=A0A7Z0GMN1_9MICC|nr:hypothetical protein [Nesterenkonia xinjiangensis]